LEEKEEEEEKKKKKNYDQRTRTRTRANIGTLDGRHSTQLDEKRTKKPLDSHAFSAYVYVYVYSFFKNNACSEVTRC